MRVPDLVSLECLLTVARAGSMSAAARELRLSQQTVSSRIRNAEKTMGVTVFRRSATGIDVTVEGRSVLEWARTVTAAAEQLDAGLAALRGAGAASLTLAASMTIADHLVPTWSVWMSQRHPQIRPSVRLMNSAAVATTVLDGGAELGFIESPEVPTGLDYIVVAEDTLLTVVAPGHQWAQSGHIRRSELCRTPLVQREEGSGTRETLEAVIGTETPPLVELTSGTAVKAAVLTANAPAVMSSIAVADDLDAGRLVAVEVDGVVMPRRLRAVWRADSPPTGAAKAFLDVVLTRRAGAAQA